MAEDIVCTKKMFKVVTIDQGDLFTYKTQASSKYAAKTRCKVVYKTGPTCSSINFSCSKFNLTSKKKSCRGGDKMTVVADQGERERFCQQFSPSVNASESLIVRFTSNKRGQSSGALCTAQCSSPTPITSSSFSSPDTTSGTPGVSSGYSQAWLRGDQPYGHVHEGVRLA